MTNIEDTNEWKKIRLGDIIAVLTDYTANGSFASLKNNVTYFNTPDYAVLVRTTDLDKSTFKPERYTNEKGYKYLKKTSLYGGEIVLANVGSVGKVFKVPKYEQPMTLAPNTYLIKFNKNTDKEYIFQWLSSDEFRRKLLSIIGSTTLQAINKNNLRSIKLSIPKDLKEQEKIASILSIIDSSIEKTQQLIDKYKSIKQGLMQDLFRFGIDGNGQIRSEKTHKFKDSPLGRIPEEWDVLELGKWAFVTKLAGFEYTKFFDYSKGGEIIAVRALNLKNGKLDLSDVHHIPKRTAKFLTRSQLHKGDLVISYVGTLGEVAIIPHDHTYHLAPNVAKISLSKDKYIPEFVLQTFLTNIMQNQILLIAGSTTQAALSMGYLRTLKILTPKKNEQEKIIAVLNSANINIENEITNLNKLKSVKQGLMQDLLSGKVRVNHLLD